MNPILIEHTSRQIENEVGHFIECILNSQTGSSPSTSSPLGGHLCGDCSDSPSNQPSGRPSTAAPSATEAGMEPIGYVKINEQFSSYISSLLHSSLLHVMSRPDSRAISQAARTIYESPVLSSTVRSLCAHVFLLFLRNLHDMSEDLLKSALSGENFPLSADYVPKAGTLSGALSATLSGILSRITSEIASGIVTGIASGHAPESSPASESTDATASEPADATASESADATADESADADTGTTALQHLSVPDIPAVPTPSKPLSPKPLSPKPLPPKPRQSKPLFEPGVDTCQLAVVLRRFYLDNASCFYFRRVWYVVYALLKEKHYFYGTNYVAFARWINANVLLPPTPSAALKADDLRKVLPSLKEQPVSQMRRCEYLTNDYYWMVASRLDPILSAMPERRK